MTLRRRFTLTTALAASALLMVGCTSTTTAPETQAAPEPVTAEPADVRVALDWELNTNHLGIVVAEALGYFSEAGLAVEIVPYQFVGVAEMVTTDRADFGIIDQTAVHIERAAGLPIKAVLAITQTETGRIIALPNRADITRPSDLDNKVFGGFDTPVYSSIARAVIEGDGGEGHFDEITLNTSTYEALAAGDVDFTLSVATWEDLLAEMNGNPYTTFRYQDFGMPEVQTLGIISTDEYLQANPEVSRAFVQAVKRGLEYAVANPSETAELLIAADVQQLEPLRELVHASAELMATEYFVAEGRTIGELDATIWNDYGAFLFARGLIADATGTALETEPDWSEFFTNEYIHEE